MNHDELEKYGPSKTSFDQAKSILAKYEVENKSLLKDFAVALDEAFMDGQEYAKTMDFLKNIKMEKK